MKIQENTKNEQKHKNITKMKINMKNRRKHKYKQKT